MKIGIYNPYLDTKGGGEKVCLALAEALARHDNSEIHLIMHDEVDLKSLENYFDVDLSNVKVFIVNFDTFFMRAIKHLPLTGAVKNLIHDLKVFRRVKRANFDMFINNCYQSNLPGPSKKNVYMCMFPQVLKPRRKNVGTIKSIYQRVMRFAYRALMHPRNRHAVYTYDFITANSAYTQAYIKKYWELDSKVLYPICENMLDSKYEKQKQILNVGRFFENSGDNHHKKQDVLVDAFLKMTDLHKDGWQLHLAGSVPEDAGALRYILHLLKITAGAPIYFHFNSSFSELKALYNQASLYWHATGYGSDPNKKPEKQEHFGISTVEAMSTGCIPVVINAAGQKESVIDGVNGFLWDTPEQLMDASRKVIRMPKGERAPFEQQAQQAARQFDKAAFIKQVETIFG